MRIDVLTIAGCPHGPTANERVDAAVRESGVADVTVVSTIVDSAEDASLLQMHGSPTILIDGHDAFPEPGSVASLSCRLYRTPSGAQGCPTVAALVDVIRSDGH